MSKIGNFESDIAPQVAKFYRRLYGGGKVCAPPPTIPMSVKLRSFEELSLRYFWQEITFKLGNRINLKARFPAELTECP